MKKYILVALAVGLLAAGCNKAVVGTGDQNTSDNSSSAQSSDGQAMKDSSKTNEADQGSMTDKNKTAGNTDSAMMTGSSWDGMLKPSDNPSKGNYIFAMDGHSMYLKTSRDYNSLVGKEVTVTYSGTMDNFTLKDIMAKSAMQDSQQMMKK